MSPDLKRRYLWFKAHAYPQASTALRLAKAEKEAEDLGLTVEWEGDDCGDLGDHEYWCADAKRGKCQGHEVLQASIRDPKNSRRFIASLCGIIDPGSQYSRVVEAELACEALETLATDYANNPPRGTLADLGSAP